MSRIIKALTKFDRRDFVPNFTRVFADLDQALPIGHGQTISQPSTVRKMLTWLDPQPDERVLDIGSGSGWTTALLSELVGDDGSVDAVERIPELVERGRANCAKYNLRNVEFFLAGDSYGLPSKPAYDRILVSAAAEQLPTGLLDQLRPGGKLVIPVAGDILEVTASANGPPDIRHHSGFTFVPLIG